MLPITETTAKARPRRHRSLVWLLGGLFTGASVLAIALYSLSFHGRGAMTSSDLAFDEGDTWSALAAAQTAASYYYPGASHVRAAHERMKAIGVGAEGKGDDRLAQRAWAALRASTLEVYHPGGVADSSLEHNDTQLARLLVRGQDEQKERRFTERQLLVEMRSVRPRQQLLMGAGLGYVLLLLGAGTWLYRAKHYRFGPVGEGVAASTYPALEKTLWTLLIGTGAMLWVWAATVG